MKEEIAGMDRDGQDQRKAKGKRSKAHKKHPQASLLLELLPFAFFLYPDHLCPSLLIPSFIPCPLTY
jgi:hypothetical protein